MSFRPLRTVSLTALALAATPALADQPQGPLSMDALVVTGTRTETAVQDSPVSVTVLNADEIARTNATSIADVLRDVPGVTVDESSLAGLKRLRIRGEEARRGAVLIDGQEITDHTSYGAPILVDPAMIERIEVVRGPQSVLYGSKAISGVVNIITKKGGDRPLQGSVGSSFISATTGYSANGLVRGSQDGWEWRLFAGRVEESDRRAPSGPLDKSNFESRSASGYVARHLGDHTLAVNVDRYELSSGSFVSPSTLGTAFNKFELDMPKRDFQKFGLQYDWTKPSDLVSKVHADAYYQIVDREFTQKVSSGSAIPAVMAYDYEHTDSDTQGTFGATAQVDWTPHPDHALITGIQYIRDDLDKQLKRTGRRGIGLATAVDLYADMTGHTQTLSVFAEDTWKLPADFSVVGGLRHYWIESALDSLSTNDTGFKKTSGSDDAPIASLTVLYKGVPDTTLRAGFSQGYVYPTLLQAYTGTYFGSFATVRPNPGLKPETSNNYEVGARYQAGGLAADGSLFYSSTRNYIASASCSWATDVGCASTESTYVNLDKVKSFGAELATQYRVGDSGFTPYATGAAVQRRYSYRSVDTYQTGVPSLSGRVGLRHDTLLWDQVAFGTDLYMRGGTRADELSQSSTGTTSITRVGGWRTFNVSFTADVADYHVGLDLLNLTDHAYQAHPDEMTQPGRSFTLNLKADF
jgi:hemoglobin/transferrin/lactoferrin receptor protein